MKNYLLLLLGLSLISCTIDPIDNYPCPDGNCDAEFTIDTIQNPGSYKDSDGVWNIKYSGLNYFRIKGKTDKLKSQYIINGTPLIETGYDSNYFYIPNQVTWTYPIYSFLGLYVNNNLSQAIPIGTQTYTLPQIVGETSVSNMAGYQISKHFNFEHVAAKTMLQSYSKYTYTPTQHMVFFPDMIGDIADIYVRVTWNTDFGGESVGEKYKIKVKFIN